MGIPLVLSGIIGVTFLLVGSWICYHFHRLKAWATTFWKDKTCQS